MPDSAPLYVKLPPELDAAIRDHCERTGVEKSAFVREAIASALGDPKLAEMRSAGRPPLGDH